eukprot:1157407-Pelagomonas_calceolata.AAC.4
MDVSSMCQWLGCVCWYIFVNVVSSGPAVRVTVGAHETQQGAAVKTYRSGGQRPMLGNSCTCVPPSRQEACAPNT